MGDVENLDASLAKRRLENYDATLEAEMRGWIAGVLDKSEYRSVGSLHDFLKDGRVLCQLMMKLCPGLIDRVNDSRLAFKQIENIAKFRSACMTLGFVESELFNSIDLFENKDLMPVLLNLRRLRAIVNRYSPTELQQMVKKGGRVSARGIGPDKATASATLPRHSSTQPSATTHDPRKDVLRREVFEAPDTLSTKPSSSSAKSANTATNGIAGPPSNSPAAATLVVPQKDPRRSSTVSAARPSSVAYAINASEHSAAPTRASLRPMSVSLSRGAQAPSQTSLAIQNESYEREAREEFKYNPELAKACRAWMEAVLGRSIEPADDLEAALKSGVVLCQVANKVRPGAVKKVNTSKIAYLQIENLSAYLRACEMDFGMRQSDLFSTSDLFEGRKMSAVLNHINVLAKTLEKIDSSIPRMDSVTHSRSLWEESLRPGDVLPCPAAGAAPTQSAPTPLTPEHEEILKWVNRTVEPLGLSVRDLSSDLRSGVVFIRLIETLTQSQFPFFYAQPSSMNHYIDNASYALRFVAAAAAEDVQGQFGARDLVTGDVDTSMRFLRFLREKFDLEFLFQMTVMADGGSAEEAAEAAAVVQAEEESKSKSRRRRDSSTIPRKHRGDTLKKEKKHKKESGSSDASPASSAPSSGPASPKDAHKDKKRRHADKARTLQRTPKVKHIDAQGAESDSDGQRSPQAQKALPLTNSGGLADPARVEKARNVVRKRVADELLGTEESYVHSLREVVRKLVLPARGLKALPEEELRAVFMNIEELHELHQPLLLELRDCVGTWSAATRIGCVFLRHLELVNHYAEYLRGYSVSLVALRVLPARREEFRLVKEKFDEQNAQGTQLPLEAHLIMPVQRLPRYLLLLKELSKYTAAEHADVEDLARVMEEISRRLDAMNQGIDRNAATQVERLLQIEEQMDVPEGLPPVEVFQPQRYLLREGVQTLKVQKTKSPGQRSSFRVFQKQYYFFMFNDMLLVCSRRKDDDKDGKDGKEFSYAYDIMFSNVVTLGLGAPPATAGTTMTGLTAEGLSAQGNLAAIQRNAAQYYFTTRDGDSWTLTAKDAEEKDQWWQAIVRILPKTVTILDF